MQDLWREGLADAVATAVPVAEADPGLVMHLTARGHASGTRRASLPTQALYGLVGYGGLWSAM